MAKKASAKKTSTKKAASKRGRTAEPIVPKGLIAGLSEKAHRLARKGKGWRVLVIALFGLGLALWAGLSLFVSEYAVAWIMVRVLPESAIGSNVVNAVYQVIAYAVSMAIMIFVPWRVLKYKTTRDELGLRGMPTWTDLLLAPIGFVAVTIASGALMALMVAMFPQVNWEQAQEVGYKNLYQLSDFILAFVCLVILAPVCEEIVFRGWLYGKLRFRMPALPAILITSVLFGIMHGQLNVGVTVFAMSLGMCAMRELTGTIWSGMLLHMIKNGIAFYFLFVM